MATSGYGLPSGGCEPPLRRRDVLLATPLLLTACLRRPPAPAPSDSPAARERVEAGRAARIALLARPAAPPGPATTAAPPVDLLAASPELRGLGRVAHRLHPVRANSGDLKTTQSHVGGPFAWPAAEPWPKSATGELLVPVLQLLEADAPPQWAFKPGTDCVQVFWNPRLTLEGKRQLAPKLVYRKLAEVGAGVAAHPLAGLATEPDSPGILREAIDLGLVPLPCSLRTERVLEYPSLDVLPGRMRDKLAQTLPGGVANYALNLSACPGSKVGGAAPRQPNAKPPACPVCAWGMDYLLTLAAREWPAEPSRWAVPGGEASPLGLEFEPGAGDLFVCRRCGPFPAACLV